METGDENCITPREKVDNESSQMESSTQHWNESMQSSGKTKKKGGKTK